jgi:superfamily II DNA/RNA helicase
LRCVVVHSVDISDAENERRLRDFHAGRYDVLIQVKKASEGFDAPTVSVLLKLDAVFSREPVIQQLGRGLRFNHAVPEEHNVLHVFIGRDRRLAPIIEHLEREIPPSPMLKGTEAARENGDDVEPEAAAEAAEEKGQYEILDVVEAGDTHLDHTGRVVDGQQLTMFGVPSPPVRVAAVTDGEAPAVEVVDLASELREAVEYCKAWTSRAARRRAEVRGQSENHFASLNLAYARDTGMRGALATPAQYRAKGDWMRRQFETM